MDKMIVTRCSGPWTCKRGGYYSFCSSSVL